MSPEHTQKLKLCRGTQGLERSYALSCSVVWTSSKHNASSRAGSECHQNSVFRTYFERACSTTINLEKLPYNISQRIDSLSTGTFSIEHCNTRANKVALTSIKQADALLGMCSDITSVKERANHETFQSSRFYPFSASTAVSEVHPLDGASEKDEEKEAFLEPKLRARATCKRPITSSS